MILWDQGQSSTEPFFPIEWRKHSYKLNKVILLMSKISSTLCQTRNEDFSDYLKGLNIIIHIMNTKISKQNKISTLLAENTPNFVEEKLWNRHSILKKSHISGRSRLLLVAV